MATIRLGSHSGNVKNMSDLADARLLVQQLDRAIEVPITFQLPAEYHPDGKPFIINVPGGAKMEILPGAHPVPHGKGVFNISNGTYSVTAGEDYSILQHGDGFGTALQVIENLGVKSLFGVENDGNTARMEVLFPEITVKDDTQEGVLLGVRMVNSYDMSSSFRGELFGYRQWCSNGMYSKKILGEVKINARHVGDNFTNLEQNVQKFVKHVIDSPAVVESVITRAINSKLEFATHEQVYETILTVTGNMKQADSIASQIPLVTDRYTVYNSFTRYLSHADVTHKTRDDLAIKAETVLLNDRFVPVEETKKKGDHNAV